ncbi:bacillithiol biosynthesis cysteine-adding enzyme BshC [Paenibacillus sp. OSY-SE]|uniref:bacillithiol biosynthesis cysteine-adding enzyme BshC n=1 Tax=Paenibacillus sp. OSY-SE TaxID=1196323 RepID=UPI000315C4F0|nr:bacillithiol biosynthesis cysteine-adding enzyme BshC [Paenibacillus sp. OSY-SE]
MTWPLLHIPVQQPLAAHYIEHQSSVIQSLYEFHPDEDVEKRAEWLDGAEHLRADRSELAQVLRRYNQQMNNCPAVMEAIDRLVQSEALVVVGGQQGGLLTGPLLVIYKAVSIIRMAQEAEARLGRPVVPVFWIAGEDHDFDEVNHTYVLNQEPAVQRIRIGKPHDLRAPVSHVKLEVSAWESVLAEVEELMPSTEFKPALMDELRQMAKYSTLSDAFAHMIGRLFGEYGLVLIDSADPAIRKLEAPMFQAIIEENDSLEEAYAKSEQDLRTMGYTPQAERSEHSANLFVIHEGERQLLHKENGSFVDRHRTLSWSKAELLNKAGACPQELSNNVLTRPLMQEFLFPVLATVLGPGEIAYWAQTKQAFRTLGMRMPLIWPRMSFTCMEGTLQKLLVKYDLTAEDVIHHYEEKKELWLKSQDELHLDDRFGELRHDVDARYRDMLSVLNDALPALGRLGETNHAKVLEQIDFLHHRAKDALQKQHESGLRQWERLKVTLHPNNKPQERVLNMIMYACRYGEGWFKPVMDAPVVWKGEHRLITL